MLEDWLLGRGGHRPTFVTPQKKVLQGQSELILLNEKEKCTLRFLYIEAYGDGVDNIRLLIDGDSFYFNFSLGEMMNYNMHNMIRDIPSLILADPTSNRYILMFKPFPPLYFNSGLKISLINTSPDDVNINYALSYSVGG